MFFVVFCIYIIAFYQSHNTDFEYNDGKFFHFIFSDFG